MDKENELRRSKRNALLLLLTAAGLFAITLFLPPNFWVSGLKAISEAAMVGALADWFAVVALFMFVGTYFGFRRDEKRKGARQKQAES